MDPQPALAATVPATGDVLAAVEAFGAPLGRGARIDRYVIEDVLGAGGMGIVYRAVDPELGRPVALKLVRAPNGGSSPTSQGQARLLREAQAMAKIAHPNIVTVYDVGVARDQVFVAMELVDGVSMSTWLRERPRSWREVLHVMQQAGRGLEAAHAAGLVHRDFKPDNILVGRDGRVRVVDLGLARPAAAPTPREHDRPTATGDADPSLPRELDLTRTGAIIGTPLYMAPEQHLGEAVDARTDQYSFCVTLFEGLYGTFPFTGATYPELVCRVLGGGPDDPPRDARVPRWLHRIVLRGLSTAPDARYPSMSALLDALERGLSRKWRLWLAGGLVAALGVAALVLGSAPTPLPAAAPIDPSSAAPALLSTAVQRQATFIGTADLPRLSPDGSHLAYVTERCNLFVQDLATGEARLLSRWPYIGDLRWSPDGATLLVSSEHGVFTIPGDGGERAYIASGAAHVAWSSDGRTIVLTRYPPERITFVDLESGAERWIPSGLPSTFIIGVDWSHTDDRLLLLTQEASGSALWTIRPDGGKLRQIHRMASNVVALPRWIGRDIVTYHRESDDESELVALRLGPDGAAEEIGVLFRGGTLGEYDLSRDGKRLAYTAIHRNQNIVRMTAPPDGAPVAVDRLTTGTQTKRNPKPSPDGTSLAFVMSAGSRTGHIFVMPLAGGAPRQLTAAPQHIVELAWSPDGRALAYTADIDGEIQLWRLDLDGGDASRFTIDNLGIGLAWAPGDAILIQRSGSRNYAVLDPNTGTHHPLVADDSVGWMGYPFVAPDRTRIAVFWNRHERGIWSISLQDGAQTRFAPGRLTPIGWSPDGESVYIHESGQIVAVAEGGKKRPVMTLPAELAVSALLHVPGTFSFVAIDNQDKHDIWLTGDFSPDAV
ncbi:MAG TPA: protein kinase, partial [Nannocystis sp.]